jgi:hypothetical protein
MKIRDHLEALRESGYYANIFASEPAPESILEDRWMRTEISVAFPLLNDSGREILHLAWTANRGGQQAGGPHTPVSDEQSESEVALSTLVEAVENLVETENFTDSQVEFIACEMLGLPGPVAA